MPTLLLRLEGPMQSWGTTSRFDQRDTSKEPSKSGVLGILCAAMGIDRENWVDLEPLTLLKMAVRHDKPGILKKDFQTAGQGVDENGNGRIIKADGKTFSDDGVVSERFYLSDAKFLVGLEGDDFELLKKAHEHLKNPKWVIGLGRKSYLPSEPVYLPDGLRENESLREAVTGYPFLRRFEPPEKIAISFESNFGEGRMVMDQPFSPFAERKFQSRYVKTELLSLIERIANVST